MNLGGLLLALTLVLLPLSGQCETIDLFGRTFEVTGRGVAKSTTARIVDVFKVDPLREAKTTVKRVYVPAGTQLWFLNYSYRDGDRRWNLAATIDGLLLFIVGGDPQTVERESSGYYKLDYIRAIAREAGVDGVAIVQDPIGVRTNAYGPLLLSASETLPISTVAQHSDVVEVVINKTKVGDQWTVDELVKVPRSSVATVFVDDGADDVKPKKMFLKYDVISEAKSLLLKSIAGKKVPDDFEDAAANFLNTRFVDSKVCSDLITIDYGIEAAIGLKVETLLSPISGRLELTGNIRGKREYAKTEEFTTRRVVDDRDVYEVKIDTSRVNCASPASSFRIFVSGGGISGEINSGDLKTERLAYRSVGVPIYTCGREYILLREILTNRYSLPTSIAAFTLAYFAEFRNASNPGSCVSASDVQP